MEIFCLPSVLYLTLSLLNLGRGSVAQHVSSQTYCSRIYHSISIINETLYVDGGELRTTSPANTSNITTYIPSAISTINLSIPFTNTLSTLWQQPSISKLTHPGAPAPPTLNSGTQFITPENLYLYGGSISVVNLAVNAPTAVPDNSSVWQYTFSTKQWSVASPDGVPVQRMTLGAAVQSQTAPYAGYYLGGVKQPASDPYFWTIKGATPYMTQGLLSLDPETPSFTNTSTTSLDPLGTSAQGFISLIETIGPAGILVSFGGWSAPAAQAMNITDDQLTNPSIRQNLSSIYIFDLASQTWYAQPASGDIPHWRYVGCSVTVSAPDKSSYSSYVYGGWGGTFDNSDGDVYVLSLTSFRWIRVNSEGAERSRHQCALAGKNTMVVVGGIVPYQEYPIPTWTSAGCDSNSTTFKQGLATFSLNTHSWSHAWDPKAGADAYQIHPSISKIIGGRAQGEATLTSPANGWAHPDLDTLFTNPSTIDNPASTSAPSPTPHRHLPTGAIAGTAIASTIALAIIVALSLTAYLRHRRKTSPRLSRAEMDCQAHRQELAMREEKSEGADPFWRSELGTGVETVAEMCPEGAIFEKDSVTSSQGSSPPPRYEKPLPRWPVEMEG